MSKVGEENELLRVFFAFMCTNILLFCTADVVKRCCRRVLVVLAGPVAMCVCTVVWPIRGCVTFEAVRKHTFLIVTYKSIDPD